MAAIAGTVFSPEAEALKPDWAQFDRYAKANTELISQPDNGRRVVFFGNSITDNWASRRPEFFASHGYTGRGIGGQSTYQFLARFREDVVNLHPAIVVINAATNDIAENTHRYNEDRTFGNICSMVEIARANGIDVILTTTLPAGHFGWNPEIKDGPEKITRLNERLKKYAADNGLTFVDYYSKLLDPDGRSLNKNFTGDGVHPNNDCYQVMESIITPVIEQKLSKKK